MAKREVWWNGNHWCYVGDEKVPMRTPIYSEPSTSAYYWTEVPDDPKAAPAVKSRTLYTLTVNGAEIEAEEKVWRALRAQLVDLFGVYDPSTPREER